MKKIGVICAVLVCLIVVPVSGQIRDHYVGKSVQILQPVPKDIPMMVFDRPGNPFDLALLKLKFERSGMGLEAGTFAVIKNVEISGNEIQFELVGTGTTPPPPGNPYTAFDEEIWDWGAGRIAVRLAKDISSYEMPITHINRVLEHVVTTRELVSAEGLPEHFQEAIKKGKVIRGMNQRAIYLMLGAPDDVITKLENEIINEAWIYRRQDMSTTAVLFRDGIVFMVKDY